MAVIVWVDMGVVSHGFGSILHMVEDAISDNLDLAGS